MHVSISVNWRKIAQMLFPENFLLNEMYNKPIAEQTEIASVLMSALTVKLDKKAKKQ